MARTTVKDLEIRLALVEQGFTDIKRRLEHIEITTVRLSAAVERGVGAWKGLLFIVSVLGAVVSFVS